MLRQHAKEHLDVLHFNILGGGRSGMMGDACEAYSLSVGCSIPEGCSVEVRERPSRSVIYRF